jgi:hypothetical protein
MISSATLVADENNGLYIGAAYASTNMELSVDGLSSATQDLLDASSDSVLLLAGYNINKNLGLEGRYYVNASEIAFESQAKNTIFSGAYKAETIAFYAKPKYEMGIFTLYGLLGMSFNNYTANDLLGGNSDDALFSWGGGAKFNVTQSLGLFVDYTDLGESDNVLNTNLSSWNLGVSYQF